MKKLYVVLSADNVSTDITSGGVFANLCAAEKALTQTFRDYKDCFDKCEIESFSKKNRSYEILLRSGDFFFGKIVCLEPPAPESEEKT